MVAKEGVSVNIVAGARVKKATKISQREHRDAGLPESPGCAAVCLDLEQ